MSSPGVIWEQSDPKRRRVKLLEKTWSEHVQLDHPEIPASPPLREAVADPDYIVMEQRVEGSSSIYYRLGGIEGFPHLNLAVVVQWHEDERGQVSTAYVTKSPKMGDVEWIRPTRR